MCARVCTHLDTMRSKWSVWRTFFSLPSHKSSRCTHSVVEPVLTARCERRVLCTSYCRWCPVHSCPGLNTLPLAIFAFPLLLGVFQVVLVNLLQKLKFCSMGGKSFVTLSLMLCWFQVQKKYILASTNLNFAFYWILRPLLDIRQHGKKRLKFSVIPDILFILGA